MRAPEQRVVYCLARAGAGARPLAVAYAQRARTSGPRLAQGPEQAPRARPPPRNRTGARRERPPRPLRAGPTPGRLAACLRLALTPRPVERPSRALIPIPLITAPWPPVGSDALFCSAAAVMAPRGQLQPPRFSLDSPSCVAAPQPRPIFRFKPSTGRAQNAPRRTIPTHYIHPTSTTHPTPHIQHPPAGCLAAAPSALLVCSAPAAFAGALRAPAAAHPCMPAARRIRSTALTEAVSGARQSPGGGSRE